MKVILLSSVVVILTVLCLFLALDAGAKEADVLLLFAPVNTLCGIALCTIAFRRNRIWTGILGLSMMAIWPFFSLGLMTQEHGVVRQLIVGAIATTYALIAGYCMYQVVQREKLADSTAHGDARASS